MRISGAQPARRPLLERSARCRVRGSREHGRRNSQGRSEVMRFKGKVALDHRGGERHRARHGRHHRAGGRTHRRRRHQPRASGCDHRRDQGGRAARPIPTTPTRSIERQVDNVVADAAKRFGRIDILVNAVGGSTIIAKPGATTEELTLADWQALIHFNLTGTFLFTHAVIPVMKRQKSGKIVNLASIAGRGKSTRELIGLRDGQGRHHRPDDEARPRARTPRYHRQRHRSRHDADRAHPPALGAAPARGARSRHREDAVAAYGRGGGPGQRHLLPRLLARRLRHGAHDRRDGRALSSADLQSGASADNGE